MDGLKAKILRKVMIPLCDVIMGTMAFQITSLNIVYSTVYSGAGQRKHQSSASQIHTFNEFSSVVFIVSVLSVFMRFDLRTHIFRIASLGLWKSYCPSACEITLKDLGYID